MNRSIAMAMAWGAGVPKSEIAENYGVSLSNFKTLIDDGLYFAKGLQPPLGILEARIKLGRSMEWYTPEVKLRLAELVEDDLSISKQYHQLVKEGLITVKYDTFRKFFT